MENLCFVCVSCVGLDRVCLKDPALWSSVQAESKLSVSEHEHKRLTLPELLIDPQL